MAVCDNCSAEINGRYCANCGKPSSPDIPAWSGVEAGAPEAPEAPEPPGPPDAPPAPDMPCMPELADPMKAIKDQIAARKRLRGDFTGDDEDSKPAAAGPANPMPNFGEAAKAAFEARQKRLAEKEAAGLKEVDNKETNQTATDKSPMLLPKLRPATAQSSVEKTHESPGSTFEVKLRPTQKVPLDSSKPIASPPRPSQNSAPSKPSHPLSSAPPPSSSSSSPPLSSSRAPLSSPPPSSSPSSGPLPSPLSSSPPLLSSRAPSPPSLASSSSPASPPMDATPMFDRAPRQAVDLSLSAPHASMLCKVAGCGVGLIVFALFFMGTLAPRYLGLSLHRSCNIAGVLHIVLLALLFFASFAVPVKHRSKQQKIMGFLVFWFYASLTFNLTWQLPLWNVPLVRDVKLGEENLWWAIVWWSYTVSDKVYFDKTPMMISIETFWLLGNFCGAAGLLKFHRGQHSRSLFFFALCGALQCYNATFYIFITWYVDNFTPIGPEPLDRVVYWGFNCLWALLSLLASVLSYRLLASRLEREGAHNKVA